jgi:hypothetical protein
MPTIQQQAADAVEGSALKTMMIVDNSDRGIGQFYQIPNTVDGILTHINWIMCGNDDPTTFHLIPKGLATRHYKTKAEILKIAKDDGWPVIYYPDSNSVNN